MHLVFHSLKQKDTHIYRKEVNTCNARIYFPHVWVEATLFTTRLTAQNKRTTLNEVTNDKGCTFAVFVVQ